MLGWTEILIGLLIILLLFGASRIPKLARGLGEGVSEFKKGLKKGDEEMEQDEDRKGIAAAEGTQKEPDEADPS